MMVYETLEMGTIHMKDSVREAWLMPSEADEAIFVVLAQEGVTHKELKFSSAEKMQAEQTCDFWMLQWL